MNNRLINGQQLIASLPCGAAAGLLIWGAVHLIIIVNTFNNRMDRIAEKYDNAINATTNSSLCVGTLDHLKFNNDRGNCPTYEPCHDYCKNYFDAFFASIGPGVGVVILFLVSLLPLIWFCGLSIRGLNIIEHYRNCRRTPITSATESLNIYTSLTTDPKYLEDKRKFEESKTNTPGINDEHKLLEEGFYSDHLPSIFRGAGIELEIFSNEDERRENEREEVVQTWHPVT